MTVKAKARFTDREIFIETGGRPFILKRLADIETLWDNLADDACEDHIPYWTELWPASLAFAEWLCDHGDEIAGRSCLELGCGLGLLSILAQKLGARTLGIDYEDQALSFCLQNARLNGALPAFALMDWTRPAVRKGMFDRVIGSDIVYEARFIEPLAYLLAWALAKNGIAWIADPCRSFFGGLARELEKRGLSAIVAAEKTVGAQITGSIPIKVKIWQIAFAGRNAPVI